MTEKPNRRFWQLHLNTAVVLMFVAGGLIWANLYPSEYLKPVEELRAVGRDDPNSMFHQAKYVGPSATDFSAEYAYGFPLAFARGPKGFPTSSIEFKSLRAFVFDALSITGILYCIALFSEHLIRRREGRKP